MDPYDESRHHPSESIPDAAYPDAPYRPGEGQQNARPSPVSHTSTPVSLFPSPVSHHSHSSPWSHDGSHQSPDPGMPDVPPPPYAPPQRQPDSSPAMMGHPHAIPLQTLRPVTSAGSSNMPIYHHQGSHVGSGYYAGAPPSQSPFAPYVVSSGGPGSTMSSKQYPVGRAGLLQRRRRLLLLGTFLIGLTVTLLVVGLWYGVYNRNNDDNNDDDDFSIQTKGN
ncbi:hypothetical protein B0I35DRAFT_147193 [Stachybotrys elegans]|uniref:Uncharacterized protein n=1 Tax=Stachybotrys elegans TaxID=80388 RepID=A0A8K0SFL4_9HYPO|nr:hypothetical protein B0I35DRAFT_147193 [Stachybotrys elegans]